MKYQKFLEDSLKEAAKIANENFGKVTASIKGEDNNQVLTETDLAIGKLLVERVKATYPDYNIIDEEAGVIDNGSNFTWIIDPIDGTSNFASGIPLYGVMIGLLDNATPIAGGIAMPSLNQLMIAEKGKGTYLNNEKVHVSEENNLLNVLVAYHIDGHQENPSLTKKETEQLADIILGIRNLRIFETCYDSVLVAQGKIGAYLNQTCKMWDNVAPQIIIEEAGGVYTDFWGKPMDYTNPLEKADQNFTVCAAAPQLHKQLQEIIQKKI